MSDDDLPPLFRLFERGAECYLVQSSEAEECEVHVAAVATTLSAARAMAGHLREAILRRPPTWVYEDGIGTACAEWVPLTESLDEGVVESWALQWDSGTVYETYVEIQARPLWDDSQLSGPPLQDEAKS